MRLGRFTHTVKKWIDKAGRKHRNLKVNGVKDIESYSERYTPVDVNFHIFDVFRHLLSYRNDKNLWERGFLKSLLKLCILLLRKTYTFRPF